MLLKSKNTLLKIKGFFSNPTRVIVISFAFLILAGTILLLMPFSTREGKTTSILDALFTATSATCVTGLVVKDTFTHFTIIGQVVILLLIQLGGLGLITFVTFFNIAIRKRVGLKSLSIAQESVSSVTMYETGNLIKIIFLTTFAFELIGALSFSTVFVPKYGAAGIYISIFLSISMYCNAGFDVLGFEGEYSSFVHYFDNPIVLITTMALIICGGLGFIVWQDIYGFRKRRKLQLHTKIVLYSTAFLVIGGAIGFMIFEWNNNKTIGTMNTFEKIMNSFFQSVSTRTAGANTVPIDQTYGITKLWMVILMFIGAAPGSTGGGIKITTAFVLIMTIICVIKGKDETVIGKHKIDKSVVYKALSVVAIALVAIFTSTATIFFTSHQGITFSEIDALFESVSAFSTVGLSSGVSGVANSAAKIALILTMYIGRVGPVSLALSLAMRTQNKGTILPEAKIMVG